MSEFTRTYNDTDTVVSYLDKAEDPELLFNLDDAIYADRRHPDFGFCRGCSLVDFEDGAPGEYTESELQGYVRGIHRRAGDESLYRELLRCYLGKRLLTWGESPTLADAVAGYFDTVDRVGEGDVDFDVVVEGDR